MQGSLAVVALALSLSFAGAQRCPFYNSGTSSVLPQSDEEGEVLSKEQYHEKLMDLDIEALYKAFEHLMLHSQDCWPADGPQDGAIPSYAGLLGRLAWHCSGSFRSINNGTHIAGGCEGGRQRFWPENEWRDNVNLDKARSLVAGIKNMDDFKHISWGDLMTFGGAVGIKASGGPMKKFCFGRVDNSDGEESIPLGVEGVNSCPTNSKCKTDAPCQKSFHYPEQDDSDNFRCNLTQPDGRMQASHSVGLIYVYPEGPQLKRTDPDFNPKWVHNRSPRLSALEVRDTFKNRMGWTDRETVALLGGGHTLGRTHGGCNVQGTKYANYNTNGPHFEAVPNSGRGPTDGTCGTGAEAGVGKNTVSSGFDGAWTRNPSRWNYDYFTAMLDEDWEPVKSTFGNDQWWTANRTSPYANTRRLTADVAVVNDPIYRPIVEEYARDHARFDSDFADAWYKLVHRSYLHPHEDDLEKDAHTCTRFEFLERTTQTIQV